MQLHRKEVSTKRHYVGCVVLRSVASGVVCCRRYAQTRRKSKVGDFLSASPQGSLNPIESVVLRLTPPIWTLLSLRGTASTPGSSSLLVALRAAFSSFDKTADMRSDQAFDLIAAASGVLALVALAYLAFLLVGGETDALSST